MSAQNPNSFDTLFCISAPPNWFINATNWGFGIVFLFLVAELIVKISTGRWSHNL